MSKVKIACSLLVVTIFGLVMDSGIARCCGPAPELAGSEGEKPAYVTGKSQSKSQSSKVIEDKNVYDSLDKYLKGIKFNGAVLVSADNKTILNKGYGMADFETKTVNTPKTKYNIASITKQFTAMAVMQLRDKGLLNVNDKITKYFPQCKKWDGITIHQLLIHTSGIPGGIDFSSGTPGTGKLKEIMDYSPAFEPGSGYSYSNDGYYVLGCLIEKVSKKSYGEYLKENIFKPLGMINSEYKTNIKSIKNRACGYDAILETPCPARTDVVAGTYSAGGIFSTVEDLYKWDRALYTEKLVRKATLAEIFKRWYEQSCGAATGYGWRIKVEDNRNYVFHSGSNDGFTSFIKRCTSDKSSVIVLSNDAQSDPIDITYKLFDILHGRGDR